MGWQVTVLVTPILFATVISLFLSGYVSIQLREGHREPIVVLFFFITVASVVWTGFSALKLLQTDPDLKLLFFRLLHFGAAALPPLVFLFVLAYTDRTRWLRLDLIGGIFLLPTAFVILLFANPEQLIVGEPELIRNEIVILRVSGGPGFFVFLSYSTALVVASIGVIFSEMRRIGRAYYPQAVLLTFALLISIIFSILTEAGISPFTNESINLVPTSAALTTAALGILLGRYRLFDVPPLAYVTAMKYSPDGLFVLDRNERIVHANDQGQELLDQLDIQLDDIFTRYFDDFDPALNSGELIKIPITNADKPVYKRLFTESLTRGGRHVGWVVVFRDETIQQRQQQNLQRQNDQLEEFASVVSHDLRNPLSVAMTRLELVKGEHDSEHIEAIERSLARMENLVDDVLTLAREGEQVHEMEPVNVEDLTETCWENVETANATVQTRIDRPIRADRGRLQQVLENLIRNAIEHGGDTVTVGELDDGFYVEDDGPGIPENDRERVFDGGYSSSKEGTGFGLNIVKQIVEAHGWEIRVTNGSDGGARFDITGVEFLD